METSPTYTAFFGPRRVAAGALPTVLRAAKDHVDRGEGVAIFDDATGRPVDVDFRGTADEVVERATPGVVPVRGRPRLGVVCREVSLLPRHWEWLETQANGASAALRRLVDDARRAQPDEHHERRAREAAHRFMTAMAGDSPGYEEALRALFAGDVGGFTAAMHSWPDDVRAYAVRLATSSP